jgi:hypothetical protein
LFPEAENKDVVREYRALPLADPRAVEEVENGIWTFTLKACRRILLKNNSKNMDAASVFGLMAWVFLGRIVSSREQSNKQTVFLQYDHRNKLLMHRDSCEINKSLYSAMILASVTLLIFFISMMVNDSDAHTGMTHNIVARWECDPSVGHL